MRGRGSPLEGPGVCIGGVMTFGALAFPPAMASLWMLSQSLAYGRGRTITSLGQGNDLAEVK